MGRTVLKIVVILVCGFLALAASSVLHAQEAWLLLGRADHYELARAANGTLQDVMSIGRVAAYGESARSLAIIHFEPDREQFQLDVVDKATRQITATHPIQARLEAHLQGIVQDLVVTSRYVYFAAIRLNSAHQVTLNKLGGRLDLNQIDIADGSIRTFPLPPNCHTARLVDYNGIPLVYAWNGYAVWKLDEATMTLQPLALEQDMPDIVSSESRGCACKYKPGPGPFADDVAVPGAGVFRLSRMGTLQQVLDANLNPVPQPRVSADLGLDLGRDGEFAVLSRGIVDGRPAIGVLGVHGRDTVFQYRDPRTLQIIWEAHLPESATPMGVGSLATIPNGVLFIDRGGGTIVESTPRGPEVVWDLHQMDPSADPANTLVLLVHGSPAAPAATPASGSGS